MSYTPPKICSLCDKPESLCECAEEVLAFASIHAHPEALGRMSINGETLRVLIERAQAWGREQSAKALRPEADLSQQLAECQRMLEGEHDAHMECHRKLEALRPEAADTTRLDYLESEVKREPILLHDRCPDNLGFRGLGLGCTGRTLREAIDGMMPLPPLPQESSPK